jgi:glycosyltransferase involved in cell wall biosynthesis
MSEADVLHIVSYDVGRGAERYARALVDSLNASGTERHRLMTMFRGDEDTLDPDIALEVPRGTLRRLGLDPRVLTRLRRATSAMGPSAVVAHGGEPAKYAAFALGRLAPYCYLAIGSSHPKLGNPARRYMRGIYLERAAAIIAVSKSLASEIARERPSVADRIQVIPNGRDPGVYRPDSHHHAAVPHVLFVGRLDEQKRPLLFVDVIGVLRRRGIAVNARVVGDGPLRAEVEQRGAALGIDVLGARDDVPSLLSSSDLLVATGRPPEGLPGVLIEAGLCGLPVVTTNVPGAHDVVEDGVTGIVVPVDDSVRLVDAVESLVADDERRLAMGRAARKRCLESFTIDATLEKWRAVIRMIAS